MTRVKICGCMTVADAVAAAEAGADFIGINFTPNSRRRVSVEEASLIVRAAGTPLREMEQEEPPPSHPGHFDTIEAWFAHGAQALDRLLARKRPLVVGVFQYQHIEDVNQIADETGIDLIQLSGSEPWSDALLANRQAIQVLRPRHGMTADEIAAYIKPGAALAFMLDPSSGTGTAGEWPAAAKIAALIPLWLAGGLTPANVAAAIAAMKPWAVDVASGVETHGMKDPAKIAAFVTAVREYDEGPPGTRTDRSLDLSSRGNSMDARVFEPRRSSPRMVSFPYRGGYRYHLVFTTRGLKPLLRGRWAELAVDELKAAATTAGFVVEAFCVMPNHIHVLLAGDAVLDSDLKGFAHRFKQTVGFRFKHATGERLWHRSYYDHVVRSNEPMLPHVAYILNNPVAAGLVETPADWPHCGPAEALEEVSAPLQDRSKDLSVRVEALAREFRDHEAGDRP
ncbi:MAG: transposase [Chloroflexi bacterium]|nr:transposase [Chloroflexota bacterium]